MFNVHFLQSFVVDIYEQLKFNLYQDDAVTGMVNRFILFILGQIQINANFPNIYVYHCILTVKGFF